ncbi:MAG: hypothetical protein F9K30_09385 [Dechloromonas sp.]|nr:MAG: hypothetical protein F9K30_09385 [Dechloromonas sp.]
MKAILQLLHLAGVIVWIGGMFFAHFCLRPVAAAQLPPPQRLPLLAAVLGRFFAVVAISIVIIIGAGLAMLLQVGMAQAPLHWHLMLAGGLLMAGIFAIIYLFHFPLLRAAVAASDWPAAGMAMNRIRVLVMVNLTFGAAVTAIAVLGKYL